MKIIEEYNTTDHEGRTDYIVRKTDEVREREIYTYFPLWLNRFSWLQRVTILERKHLVKKREFDEWNYSHYWTEEKEEWFKEKIVD